MPQGDKSTCCDMPEKCVCGHQHRKLDVGCERCLCGKKAAGPIPDGVGKTLVNPFDEIVWELMEKFGDDGCDLYFGYVDKHGFLTDWLRSALTRAREIGNSERGAMESQIKVGYEIAGYQRGLRRALEVMPEYKQDLNLAPGRNDGIDAWRASIASELIEPVDYSKTEGGEKNTF